MLFNYQQKYKGFLYPPLSLYLPIYPSVYLFLYFSFFVSDIVCSSFLTPFIPISQSLSLLPPISLFFL